MSSRNVVPFLLAGALALAMAAGCGDDESPTGGGTGGNSSTLSLPSGTYAATGAFFTCGEAVPFDVLADTLVFCGAEVIDEFFGADCPVKRTGNNLSLSCETTETVGLSCTETLKASFTGTVSGDTYQLSGTFEYSDNPADCWDGTYCDSLHLTIERIGGVPTACAYADENTVALNVTGGAQAGAHELQAFGSSISSSGSYSFSFSASSNLPVTAAAAPAGGLQESIYMYVSTDYINPATLPATLPVVVQTIGAAPVSPAGGPQVYLGYAEMSPDYSFNAENAVSGNFVVHEIDGDHIAGTLNVIVSGTEYSEANPSGVPAQRTLSGGYFVTGEDQPVETGAPGGSLAGFTKRLRSLIR
ncbi:MAG: hypothetical protein OEX18_01585 [Candidatus Krumholzibacteria bacterium]|nr:hypothetical protein [Candidatus Krumholzibacteria bacterium]MDH4335955.1 hypothetical protein [Candidatus Krumholzibacteria bacterium]MDH5268469.1 hypothetical protein [Candidatus Krumholzibacteria bacterium]